MDVDTNLSQGVQIGDHNTQYNFFTINEARNVIPIPSQLPYLHNREPQIKLLSEQDNKFRTNECIKLLLARGCLSDAPEEFGNRIRDQLLPTRFNITVQRSATAGFRESSSAEDMVNLWVADLRNSMCSPVESIDDPTKFLPPIMSTDQQWQEVLESIDESKEGSIFINSVVETSRCLSMLSRFWGHWQKEIHRRFGQLKQPGRVIIYIALSPPGAGWRSLLDNHRAKRIYNGLESHADKRGLVAMAPFDRVTKQDALKWNEDYFIPWFIKNASETLKREPLEMSAYMRNQIRSIFSKNSDIYLSELADTITATWNKTINGFRPE